MTMIMIITTLMIIIMLSSLCLPFSGWKQKLKILLDTMNGSIKLNFSYLCFHHHQSNYCCRNTGRKMSRMKRTMWKLHSVLANRSTVLSRTMTKIKPWFNRESPTQVLRWGDNRKKITPGT